ncbi:MAG: radical SAM family heme chaperone HemW [Caldisericia bacterium]|nr:radical SAM family heme chaperone HemW [Caldisericia bacterium]
MKEISLYFHIPFCLKKCNYCSFYSVIFNREIKNLFVKYLLKEISLKEDILKNYYIKTIYFGGGTPSLLNEEDFELIFNYLYKKFRFNNTKETTLEINPETVNLEKFKNLIKFGINRISLGVQTFNDCSLKLLGRVHGKDKIFNSFKILRKLGFDNINFDLILGIPKESLKDVENSIMETMSLNPEHISIYSLEYHEDTKIYFDIINNKLHPWDKKKEKEGFILIKNILLDYGYKHYEFSNFSKIGFESKHNLNYWSGGEYIGFGPMSFSFINNIYTQNGNLFYYFNKIEKNKNPILKIFYINYEKLKKIFLILSLRRINGLNLKKFEEKFGKIENLDNKLIDLEKNGFIEKNKQKIKLTDSGIIISNQIFSNLI